MKPAITQFVVALGLGLAVACTSVDSNNNEYRESGASASPSATSQKSTASASSTSGGSAREASSPAATATPAGMARTALAYPTGDEATSAIRLEKLVPAEAGVGQDFEYRIVVTNLTGLKLEGVEVVDKLSPNFTVLSADPMPQTNAGGTVSWGVGSLAPRASQTIRIMGKAARQGNVGSCASVSYNTALCASVSITQPMLNLTMASITEALICEVIPMEFVVKNAGSGTTRDVTVKAQLPDGLLTKDGRKSVDLRVDDLPPGQSKKFMVEAEALRPGRFETRASASAAGGLRAESVSRTVLVREPKLEIAATAPKRHYLGTVGKWQFTVKNTGDAPAAKTILAADLGAGMKFVGATDGGKPAAGKVTWVLGTLAPGASKVVTLNMTGETKGAARGTATASAYCAKGVAASYDSETVGIPAVLLEVIDLEDPIPAGDNEVYEIKVKNQGSASDTNIILIAELDGGMEFISVDGPTSATVVGNRVTLAPLAVLAPKKTATWRLTIKGNTAGDMRFKVIMNTDELSRPVEETEATNFYE